MTKEGNNTVRDKIQKFFDNCFIYSLLVILLPLVIGLSVIYINYDKIFGEKVVSPTTVSPSVTNIVTKDNSKSITNNYYEVQESKSSGEGPSELYSESMEIMISIKSEYLGVKHVFLDDIEVAAKNESTSTILIVDVKNNNPKPQTIKFITGSNDTCKVVRLFNANLNLSSINIIKPNC